MTQTVFHSALIAFCIACCMALSCQNAKAAYFNLDGGGGQYFVPTHTLLDSRYYHIKHQKYDFSCGSAALASVLTYNYGRPTDEKNIINVMLAKGDQEKIRHEGFSLLDMKNYLQSRGLHAEGYRASLDKLYNVDIPAIVLINRKGFMHFVVVQGVTKDKVLVGDPALGKKIIPRKDFESTWENGILFVILSDMPKARSTFNTVDAWHVKRPNKFHMPLPDTELGQFTLNTAFTPNSFRR